MSKKPHPLSVDPLVGVRKRSWASKDRGNPGSATSRNPSTPTPAGPSYLTRSKSRTQNLNLAGGGENAHLFTPDVSPTPSAATAMATDSTPRSKSKNRTRRPSLASEGAETKSTGGASLTSAGSSLSKSRNPRRRFCLVANEEEAVPSSRGANPAFGLDALKDSLRRAEETLSEIEGPKYEPGCDANINYDEDGRSVRRSVRQQQQLIARLEAQIRDAEKGVLRQGGKNQTHQREIEGICRRFRTPEERRMALERSLHSIQREADRDSHEACELFRDAIQEQDTLLGDIDMETEEAEESDKTRLTPATSREVGSLETQLRGLDIQRVGTRTKGRQTASLST